MSLEKEPFVLRNVITKNNFGNASTWDDMRLSQLLPEPFDVKCVPTSQIIDEDSNSSTSNLKRELINNTRCTLKQLNDWYYSKENVCDQLKGFPVSQYSAYAGYAHLNESVRCKETGEPIKNSCLFKNLIGQLKSHDLIRANPPTLWVSYGPKQNINNENCRFDDQLNSCCTPLHYDTYGCNVVAQIQGCKRWTLFSSQDTVNLYPTRLPFEESSVLSRVNPRQPDFDKFPRFAKAKAYVVILNPGDMLFVPQHWWHFVECISEKTISLNCWLDVGLDNSERFKETLTSYIINNQLKDETLLVDSEEPMNNSLHIALLNYMMNEENGSSNNNSELVTVRRNNCLIITDKEIVLLINSNGIAAKRVVLSQFHAKHYNVETNKRSKLSCRNSENNNKKTQITDEDVLRAITQPNVINLIMQNLDYYK